jgi:branched-chain amino acid transport system ATP-binding protein
MFNLLTRFLEPTRGSIRYRGADITRLQASDVAQAGLVRSFQVSSVFPQLSALENVRLGLQRKRSDSFHFLRRAGRLDALNARARELLAAVGLQDVENVRAAEMSYGRKRALELAPTLGLEPELMLLDEPMAGLGREDIRRMTDLIREAARGRTVLIVEHNLKVIADLSDTVTVLARGKVLAQGDYATVSAHPDVREAYLGADE